MRPTPATWARKAPEKAGLAPKKGCSCEISKCWSADLTEILKFNCQLDPASGEVSRVSAEKVLAAAVAKSEELGVKVLFSLVIFFTIVIVGCLHF